MLANCSSPNSAVDIAPESRYTARVTRSSIAEWTAASDGKPTEVSMTIRPVGTCVVDTTAIVFSGAATLRLTGSVARTWDTVTTPVPPTPVTRSEKVSPMVGTAGAGNTDSARSAARVRIRSVPGVTVTNDGQSPCRQEKSRLQELWSILVLRPNS